jgi:hypothetical protein
MIRSGYFSYLVLLALTPCFVLLLHGILVRIIRRMGSSLSPLEVAAIAVMGGYPVMAFILWQYHFKFLTLGELLWPVLFAVIVYSCLAFCYFILFTMTETARRIHILQRIREEGPMAVQELASEYNASDMLNVRLERMVALKQLKRDNGKFFIRNTLLYWAGRVLEVWAKLLGFPVSQNR